MIVEVLLLAAVSSAAEDVTFTGPRGWTFEAKVHHPKKVTGPAVLLMGGGVGNDLDWTVPGILDMDGQVLQLTISGETHTDAPRIVQPLLDAGCTIMHYSTIAREDPARERWPFELEMVDPTEHMELARAACDTLTQHTGSDQPIVLIGHSMGGQRAVQVLAERPAISGAVLLACAQATATHPNDDGRAMYRVETPAIFAELDVNGDGVLEVSELPQAGDSTPRDVDGDGVVRSWEIKARLAEIARSNTLPSSLPKHDRSGLPFAEAVLAKDTRPCLMLYGSLDNAQSHHAPALMELATRRPNLDVRLIPRVGHQLGPEDDGKVGPIDTTVCRDITTWITGQSFERAPRTRSDQSGD
ncbi:MAG: alpha/beta hydrolase [Phycisphaerales bacterium]|jgi:pimeloyl-ACP methyl ester carboxylesterase|nr:alpha/beta hydrolase [Phycisphaerales bacterium]